MRLQPAIAVFPLTAVQQGFTVGCDFPARAARGGPVRGRTVAVACAFAAVLVPPGARAQEPDPPLTAEQMIEVSREVWRAPGVHRRCPLPKPGEIVVCPSDPDEFRVESPTDEAIRKGESVPDGIPRAPDVFGLPPCEAYAFCSRVGRTPEPPLLIDLDALPHPLTPEEAALVFRAEDVPDDVTTPEAASPAEAP